ncbi:MAG TPA: tetratricopeptide repeat protein [Gemmatimonadaceae bacterium]
MKCWRTVLLAALVAAVPAAARAQDTVYRAVASTTGADDPARRTAIDKLATFIARYPDSPLRANALYQLGELLVRRADDAFATAQRAGGANIPDQPDYSAAIARYEALVTGYPDFAHADAAAYTLGTLYASDQRFERAAAMFERVAELTGSTYRPEAFFRLGDARFEIASRQRGAARKASFVSAAKAYQSAAAAVDPPRSGDIYFLSLYKLGWSYYNQATRPEQPEYRSAVDVFGRLVSEYDALTPEQQARLGLRSEAIEYMAVALTQVGGAEAANQYFATHTGTGFKLAVLRRLAASLRDQGDFGKAVDAYRAVLAEAPTDSSALGVQREVVDIYQNRILEPERAQQARLALVNDFAPGTPWAQANPSLVDSANRVREAALRESAQYELSRAQSGKDRGRFGVASDLYGRYMSEFGGADSAQTASMLYGEALFGSGSYARAGSAYTLAAYGTGGDKELAARAGQNAIVAFDSAVVRSKSDRALQDSLFSAVDRYVETFPQGPAAKTALIEKGKRASDAGRWDVVASTFRTYAERFPNDAYTPTAQKLIGDALYKQGQYSDAQAQWERAQASAAGTGKRALADSINTLRNAAAVTFGDSLVKAGDYDRAAKEVYVAFADRNPSSSRAPDAIRNAIETYVIADSVARAKGDSGASRSAKEQALALSNRLVQQYPDYRYRAQYQSLSATLLADMGRREDAVKALDSLIADNPKWEGRADAMVRRAVMLDSLGQRREAAAAYESFSVAYPKDARAADAQYNAAVTYMQVPDSASAARAYGDFAERFPRDPRVGRSQQLRVALLAASGDSATAEKELAQLCRKPSAALATQCAERTGEREFHAGKALFERYQPLKLVIPLRVNLTRKGIARISAPKRELLTSMSTHFKRSIATGAPEWLAASSYYMGLAQWEYGDYLKNVELPADLTGPQLSAAQAGSAQQAEQYYNVARKTWSTLVEKAEQDSIANSWVARARNALGGNVDRTPIEGDTVMVQPADTSGAAASDSARSDSLPGAVARPDTTVRPEPTVKPVPPVTPDSTRGRVPPDTSGGVRRPGAPDVPSEVRG